MQIAGSTAVITGAASGLGEATARLLHLQGASIVLLDRSAERGQAVSRSLGERTRFVRANVAVTEDLQAAMDFAAATFDAVHILVNCAGMMIPGQTFSATGPCNIDSFKKVIAVNLVGTFDAARLAAEKMSQNEPNEWGERGVVVNTASTAAFEGQVGQAAYAASKAGIVGLTLVLARDLAGFGIRACTIAPGGFDTQGLPDEMKAKASSAAPFPRRLGRPMEFAMLVQHIVENPMLNGETIRLDAATRLGPE